MTNDREIILGILQEIMEKKQYSHLVIKNVLDKYEFLDKQERAFINRVSEGTLERMMELDYVINQFSKVKVNKMKPVVRIIIRMSVYQILYMDSVPDSAACNEAVKLAVKKGFGPLKGFVNGVLRTIAREKENIVYPDPAKQPIESLSIKYSMPVWIVQMWVMEYGCEKTELILKGLLEQRPITVRFLEEENEVEKKKWLSEVEAAGIKIAPCMELPYAFFLENVNTLNTVPGFEEGKFMVQDVGSMMVTELAEIKKDQVVVDVCGAPGGKALHAASKLGGTGSVLVRDLSERKVQLIQDNIERSQQKNIEATVWDATVLDETLLGKADVVIADLPCSGLGVIGRKSDIKYRVTIEDVDAIAELQRQILRVVSQYVKTGGTLVYSTCTITKKENENNCNWFLEQFPFEKIQEKSLLPGMDTSDGFYMVSFRRIEG